MGTTQITVAIFLCGLAIGLVSGMWRSFVVAAKCRRIANDIEKNLTKSMEYKQKLRDRISELETQNDELHKQLADSRAMLQASETNGLRWLKERDLAIHDRDSQLAQTQKTLTSPRNL